MRNSAGLQSRTMEYRWGVVDASEPPDLRLVLGFVTVLEHRSPADGPFVDYKVMFFDVNGLPLTSFPPHQLALMASAGALAMAELEEESVDALENGPPPIAVLVPLAASEVSGA